MSDIRCSQPVSVSWSTRGQTDMRGLDTAGCTITTENADAYIVTFYAGAMADARKIDLAALSDEVGGIDLAVDPSGSWRQFPCWLPRGGRRWSQCRTRRPGWGCMIAPVIAVSIIFSACGPGSHH